MSDDDGFTPLADALAAVGAELGLPSGDAVTRLVARWSEVVGADVAAHATLLSVRDGVAAIAVDSPPWATQLRFLEPALVARAQAVCGGDQVRAISVRVRPATTPGPGSKTSRKPPNSEGRSGTLE
jgi:predicted nucleic acid-binding Zn ribbon protein